MSKKWALLLLLSLPCLASVKMPNGARLSWLLMQPAVVPAPILTFSISPQTNFSLWATSNLLTPKPGWTFVVNATNSATVPLSSLDAITNQPIYAQTLAWDGSTDPVVTGYNLRFGTNSGAYGASWGTFTNTVYRVFGLTHVLHYYVVTCHDSNGVENPYSAEVSAMPVEVQQPRTIFFCAKASITNTLTIK